MEIEIITQTLQITQYVVSEATTGAAILYAPTLTTGDVIIACGLFAIGVSMVYQQLARIIRGRNV